MPCSPKGLVGTSSNVNCVLGLHRLKWDCCFPQKRPHSCPKLNGVKNQNFFSTLKKWKKAKYASVWASRPFWAAKTLSFGNPGTYPWLTYGHLVMYVQNPWFHSLLVVLAENSKRNSTALGELYLITYLGSTCFRLSVINQSNWQFQNNQTCMSQTSVPLCHSGGYSYKYLQRWAVPFAILCQNN